jgi:GntR family transcriptional regulator/MocR family aminotransferase
LSKRAQAALAASQRKGGNDALPFAPGVPDVTGFPFRAWRACLDRAWRDARPHQLGYAMHGGEPSLRAALAEYLGTARGVAVSTEQVVITAGTQAALDLCARLLADQGDTVWVENPGYPAARTAFSLAGLTLHPVTVDAEGLAPVASDWSGHPPRLIFVTPSHQYPTGVVLSLRRRLELLEGASDAGAWIIEDDYDSEFRRGGPALPAIYGLRPDLAVIYAGTFSKTLFPGLRLGYLVVPRALSTVFTEAAARAQRPGHGVEQAALADFIHCGHYTTHLRRMRQRYEARQRALRAALARHPGPESRLSGGEAGLHLTLWLPDTLPDVAVCQAAHALGLSPRPLSEYTIAPARCNGILLGYGNLEEDRIDEAVRRLRLAMRAAGA